MERITRTDLNMKIAHLIAERSTCTRKKVGCVVTTSTGAIITTGFVGSPSGLPHCLDEGCIIGPNGGCIRTVHAEQAAIAFAARRGVGLDNSILYVTLSPCVSCAMLIINSGIKKVVYDEEYRDTTGINTLRQAGIEVIRWKNAQDANSVM